MTAAQRSACFLNVSGWVPLHPAPTCPVLLALWAVRARVRVGPPGGRVRPAFWGQCGRVPTRSAPAGELREEGRSPGPPCGPRRARSSRKSAVCLAEQGRRFLQPRRAGAPGTEASALGMATHRPSGVRPRAPCGTWGPRQRLSHPCNKSRGRGPTRKPPRGLARPGRSSRLRTGSPASSCRLSCCLVRPSLSLGTHGPSPLP